jgi:hypothetical protein
MWMDRRIVGLLIIIALVALVATALSGCEPSRDISTLRGALLGHWKNIVPGSTTELYYNDTSVIFSGKRKEFALLYNVLEESKAGSTLVMRLTASSTGPGLTHTVVFSRDMRTIDVFPTGTSTRLRFSYLDERQAPDGYVAKRPVAVTAQDRVVP